MCFSAPAPRCHRAGFTLLELLAVIALVAILSGLVLGVGRRAVESGRVARARAELAAISAALETYKRIHGDYPRTDEAGQLLRALLGQRGPVSDAPIQGRALLEAAALTVAGDVLTDPWGQPYVYAYKTPPGAWKNPGFVLYSRGPDQSDFSRLTTGGFPNATAGANADNIQANRN